VRVRPDVEVSGAGGLERAEVIEEQERAHGLALRGRQQTADRKWSDGAVTCFQCHDSGHTVTSLPQ
jgi:cytochrome c553